MINKLVRWIQVALWTYAWGLVFIILGLYFLVFWSAVFQKSPPPPPIISKEESDRREAEQVEFAKTRVKEEKEVIRMRAEIVQESIEFDKKHSMEELDKDKRGMEGSPPNSKYKGFAGYRPGELASDMYRRLMGERFVPRYKTEEEKPKEKPPTPKVEEDAFEGNPPQLGIPRKKNSPKKQLTQEQQQEQRLYDLLMKDSIPSGKKLTKATIKEENLRLEEELEDLRIEQEDLAKQINKKEKNIKALRMRRIITKGSDKQLAQLREKYNEIGNRITQRIEETRNLERRLDESNRE